jgi:protein gp37
MGETTEIAWTGPNGKTWSPWFGCAKVHTGCTNCYAEEDNNRYKRNGGGWGKGAPRVLCKSWDKPLKWAREAARAGRRDKVFPSLCDPFDAEAPEGALAQFADLIWGTAQVCGECGPTLEAGHDFGCSRPEAQQGGLDWLLLTKRPENAGALMPHIRRLVWLLVSVSDQPTADKYVPALLRAEGYRLRGISYEPAVGRVDLRSYLDYCQPCDKHGIIRSGSKHAVCERDPGIGWVIAGGESGHRRRACDVKWFADLAFQCDTWNVPFFMKQDAALYPGQPGRIPDELWARKQFPRLP